MSEEATTIFGLSVGFGVFIIFLGIVWFLLCVILFFKIWGMTNDVTKIRSLLEEQIDLDHPYVKDNELSDNKTN